MQHLGRDLVRISAPTQFLSHQLLKKYELQAQNRIRSILETERKLAL
jgi:hypothetical protein